MGSLLAMGFVVIEPTSIPMEASAETIISQLGIDIDGESAGDDFGNAISLSSDGTRVAIGAPFNDGNGSDSGHVRIYDWDDENNRWVQVGSDIDGEAAYDFSGNSVSLSSDGTRVAIGASNGNLVRIYDWNGEAWVQAGSDIDGEDLSDQSGRAVSLSSDGARVAIGAPYNDSGGVRDSGHVRLYSVLTAIDTPTISVIYNGHVNPEVVITGSSFKADGVLALSDFTFVTTATGLTANSVSVNAPNTKATIVFTGTALTGTVSITAKESAFVGANSASNLLSIAIDSRTLLSACPDSSAITVACLQSGTMSRGGVSVPFRFTYSNNSGAGGASFSLIPELETSTNVFEAIADGDVATNLVILYPTSTAVGARLKTATWAMAMHKNFGYTKEVLIVNTTEVVKLTTSYEYIDTSRKDGCGFASQPFGAAPEAACESVGVSGDYQTSANNSVDFLAAGDLSWLVAETGADGGYLNYLGSSFMWGSTADTPLRFQLVGPKYKSANSNDSNSGSFQVYLPAGLVTYVYGANFNPNTNLSLTRQDSGVLTETLSGTANVIITQPNGGDLLINVPSHPFSAPVFKVSYVPNLSSTPTPITAYSGPTLDSKQSVVAGEQVSFTGRRLHYVSSAYAGTTKLTIVSGVSELLVLDVSSSMVVGSYDLVLYSSHGKLTFHQGLTITAPAPEVTQPEVIEPEAVKKLTVGTFKGFIAIYSQGYEGAKLSAKVAGKWLVVDALDESFKGNDYSRTVRFTGAGYDILVHLYINGELIKTEELTTQ